MRVTILKEAGYDEALLGLSLSYNAEMSKMPKAAEKLYSNDRGENKFLESIVVWLDVTGPLNFWNQFDTYRIGVTKQSESTMHTIIKKAFQREMFTDDLPEYTIRRLETLRQERNFTALRNELPWSFLQRRIVCMNYKSIRNVISQRKKHRLSEWRFFCCYLQQNLEHNEFLSDL